MINNPSKEVSDPLHYTQSIGEHRAKYWPVWVAVVLSAIVVFILTVKLAKPIISNDLWWHLVLGQQYLDTGSLVLDHSVFSWTPATSNHAYNSWLSDIILYLIHDLTGIVGLLFLRYFVFFSILLMAIQFAINKGLVSNPFSWCVILLSFSLCWPSMLIKPELFSVGMMSLIVWYYYNLRASGDKGWWYAYLYPVILIIWVNMHGAFFLSALFFASTIIGELFNLRFNPSQAMTRLLRKHYFIAMALCIPAILINPYGLALPLSIVESVVVNSSGDYGYIGAYQPTYIFNMPPHFLLDYMIISMMLFVFLFWQKIRLKQTDWVVILSFLGYCALYTQMVRTTYFLAPVFLFSTLDMLRNDTVSIIWPKNNRAKYVVSIISLLIFGFISWRVFLFEKIVILDPKARLDEMQIVGHRFPQLEADYILSSFEGEEIGNLYGDGGYLIYRLWPEKKVMIDPRYFPYKEWIDDYMKFTVEGIRSSEFVDTYKADLWLINYSKRKPFEWFSSSKQWSLAFFGPVGGVFVPANRFKGSTVYSLEVTRLRSIAQITNVFTAALLLRDIPFAKEIKNIAEVNVDSGHKYKKQFIDEISNSILGMEALTANDLEKAAELFSKTYSFAEGLLLSAKIYRYLASVAWKDMDYKLARELSIAAYSVLPDKTFHDIYNIALTDWHVRHSGYLDFDITNEEIQWEEYADIILDNKQLITDEQQELINTMDAMKKRIYDGKANLYQQEVFDSIVSKTE